MHCPPFLSLHDDDSDSFIFLGEYRLFFGHLQTSHFLGFSHREQTFFCRFSHFSQQYVVSLFTKLLSSLDESSSLYRHPRLGILYIYLLIYIKLLKIKKALNLLAVMLSTKQIRDVIRTFTVLHQCHLYSFQQDA